jgi:hypothetical protein
MGLVEPKYPTRILSSLLALQLRAATGGDFAFPRRFAVVLASIALAGVGGGGGLVESTEDLYIPLLIRNKLGLGFPMPVERRGFVFLGGDSSGRRRGCAEVVFNIYVGFSNFAAADRTSEEYELAGSAIPFWIRSVSSFAFPSSFPASFCGEWDLVVAGMCMVLGDGFLCGGFGPDGHVIVVTLCVGDRILLMFLSTVGAHGITGETGLANYSMLPDVWRGPGVFSSQLDEKPGWFWFTTFFGGSATLRGSSSSGVLGFLLLVVSVSSVSGDAMADGHLFQPGRSAVLKHVFDVLHKTASRNCVPSPERRTTSGSQLWPLAARPTGSSLQVPSCNLFLFQRCACKIWAVTTKTFI